MRGTRRAVFVLVCAGALPFTAKLTHAQEPKETENMNRQVYRAGINGTGSPMCISCPEPDSPDGGKYSGTIILDITVTSDGAVTDPVVLRGLGTAAAEISKKQVQKWKFRPAPGPNGKPVDCRVTVEVTFRNSLNERPEGKRQKDSFPTPITVAQAEKLKIGYRGVILGQKVFVPDTKIIDQAIARAICSVVAGEAGPELGEEFFREPGASRCAVTPDESGRVARITVDSRTSVPQAVAFLSSEYGSPEPELSSLRAGEPVDVTAWSWIVRDQNLKTVETPRITLEPKVRLSQRKDEYASYVEIVFSH